MHDPHRNSLILQIQAQQLPHHVQRRLASMVPIVPSTLLLMPQRNAPTLRAHQHHLGAFCQAPLLHEMVHQKDWCNGAGGVHLDLLLPIRLVERLQPKVSGADDGYVERGGGFDRGGEGGTDFRVGELDVWDPLDVFVARR